MTPFRLFIIYAVIAFLAVQWAKPLQPDQLTDDLSDIDMDEHWRKRAVREASWWDDPVVNVKLSRRG